MLFSTSKHVIALLVLASSSNAFATILTFGSGANQFAMDFVAIGNPGNAADTTGRPSPSGSVGYSYQINKYEVSRDMIIKANSAGGLGITLANMSSYGGNGLDRPATGVSWFESARFANWLNTSTGYNPAYKFDGNGNFQLWQSGDTGFDPANPFRNTLANYVLPSADEWWKAAYYDPYSADFFDFSTGSNAVPVAVTGGTLPGTVVYDQSLFQGPADVNNAGGLSPYGVMALGGNVSEWEETEYDLVNDSTSANRFMRGGSWGTSISSISTARGYNVLPEVEDKVLGFRVVSLSSSPTVPEPSSIAVWGLIGVCGLMYRRRRTSSS